MRFRCSSRRSFWSIRTSASVPKPVLMPYAAASPAAIRSTRARAPFHPRQGLGRERDVRIAAAHLADLLQAQRLAVEEQSPVRHGPRKVPRRAALRLRWRAESRARDSGSGAPAAGRAWRSTERGTDRPEVRRHVGRRRSDRIQNVARRCLRRAAAGHDVVVVVSAMSGETNRLLKLVQAVNERPERARAGRGGGHRRAGHHRAAVAGHPGAGRAGGELPRPPVPDRDRQHVHQGAHQAHRRGAAPRRAPQGRHRGGRRVPGRGRGRGTSPRSAAAARTPPRWRSPRRSRPTPARSTPTWTASTPPTPTCAPRRASSTASATRRCWSWPRSGRRCCRSARWSSR